MEPHYGFGVGISALRRDLIRRGPEASLFGRPAYSSTMAPSWITRVGGMEKKFVGCEAFWDM